MADRRLIAMRFSSLVDVTLPLLVVSLGFRDAVHASIIVLGATRVVDACLYTVLGDIALSLLEGVSLGNADLVSCIVNGADGVVDAALYAVLVDEALLETNDVSDYKQGIVRKKSNSLAWT